MCAESSITAFCDEMTMSVELRKALQINDCDVMAAHGFPKKIMDSESRQTFLYASGDKRKEDRMNITFLIGNGFDVNLGLKTQYNDFYPKYLESKKNDALAPCVAKFCEQIKADEEQKFEKWSDFEKAFGENITGTNSEIGEILADFDNSFAIYLKQRCELCDYNNPDIEQELSAFVLTPYDQLELADKNTLKAYYKERETQDHIYSFITLNYTDTLEKLVPVWFKRRVQSRVTWRNRVSTNSMRSILHLHGSLAENYMIIGLDSLSQFKDETMQGNQKLLRHCVKSEINKAYGYGNKETDYINIINTSDVIYAYGMAFGVTDKSRIDVIRNWLKSSVNHKLVVYKYNSGFDKLDGMNKGLLLDAIDAARDEYLKLLGFNESEYEAMHERIFVIDSAKALRFKLIEEETLSETRSTTLTEIEDIAEQLIDKIPPDIVEVLERTPLLPSEKYKNAEKVAKSLDKLFI